MNDPVTPLSASRIKTAQSCSWLYYAKYKLALPDSGNDGSSRGSICHLVFELLGEPKRKKIYSSIIKNKDIFASKSIERLVYKHAKRLNVDDDDNINLIKEMTLNGLLYDFYGDTASKPTEAISEKDFEITHIDGDVRYKIKGFIDKLFLYKKSKKAIIRDFKSSKQVFQGKEVSDNLQDYMYSLAVRHLYPEYSNRQSEFLFLKFKLDHRDSKNKVAEEPAVKKSSKDPSGVVLMDEISQDDLDGFEYQLSAMQNYLDDFSESDAHANFAAKQSFPTDKSFSGPLQCGFAKQKGQLKKDGTPMWHCAMKFEFDYFCILNADGKVIKSYEEKDFKESLVPSGCTFEKRHYAGCPAHNKRY